MPDYLDYSTASSSQIEADLCQRLARFRLSRNITQAQLADAAGVSPRTIGRMESGEGVSLDTFIRVLMALNIQRRLAAALPDPAVRPVERVASGGTERRRARPGKPPDSHRTWTWDNERGVDG